MWPQWEEEQIKGCSGPEFVFRAPLRTLGLVEEELGRGGRDMYDQQVWSRWGSDDRYLRSGPPTRCSKEVLACGGGKLVLR